ncbi:Fe-S oxidoreductase [Desulfonispora thiosulfatigenes DSM 11270]|uniref:Fe-S oxidoreductase n=1 Tax=Desulfonispora thiosulfatigenes DSM 11270 TaxID=656914 RepID=A0A1W1UHB3_DESTI|nr:(Fe-S)-binding protein [Desulfonispora thiosulfatigenes]SMB80201.1 Fe-S oxidoreductase [Desulfonispora thiosulfatigenes DSM 11270]
MKPILNMAKSLTYLPISPPDPEHRDERALELFERMKSQFRSVLMAMESCVKCGRCANACHTYLGTQDPYNIPANRADLMRKVYKRHFTTTGRVFGSFAGGEEFSDELLEKWVNYFYQCNECRRCSVFCPFGIDTAEVTIAARQILTYLGIVPKFIMDTATMLHKSGNNMGIPVPAAKDSIEFMEDDLEDEYGYKIPLPVDLEQADILYIPSSADFFTNYDTMIGVAKYFYAIGASWTMDTSVLETANFGLFFDEYTQKEHTHRKLAAAKKCGAKKIIAGECGHGWREFKMYTESIFGPHEFEITHIHEEVAMSIKKGELKFDKSVNDHLKVTLHDPCNYARGAGLIEAPRYVLKHVVNDFKEMTPNKEKNFCCGGGSGLLFEEIKDIRKKLGAQKVKQIETLADRNYLCAPCSICKAQLPLVFEDFKKETGHEDFTIAGLMDLVGFAMVLEENNK